MTSAGLGVDVSILKKLQVTRASVALCSLELAAPVPLLFNLYVLLVLCISFFPFLSSLFFVLQPFSFHWWVSSSYFPSPGVCLLWVFVDRSLCPALTCFVATSPTRVAVASKTSLLSLEKWVSKSLIHVTFALCFCLPFDFHIYTVSQVTQAILFLCFTVDLVHRIAISSNSSTLATEVSNLRRLSIRRCLSCHGARFCQRGVVGDGPTRVALLHKSRHTLRDHKEVDNRPL